MIGVCRCIHIDQNRGKNRKFCKCLRFLSSNVCLYCFDYYGRSLDSLVTTGRTFLRQL